MQPGSLPQKLSNLCLSLLTFGLLLCFVTSRAHSEPLVVYSDASSGEILSLRPGDSAPVVLDSDLAFPYDSDFHGCSLYWNDRIQNRIYRMHMSDYSSSQVLQGPDELTHFQLNIALGQLMYTQDLSGFIKRYDFSTGSDLTTDFAAGLLGSFIYLQLEGVPYYFTSSDNVRLNPRSVGTGTTTWNADSGNHARDMVFDPVDQKLYWFNNYGTPSLRRINVDGTGEQVLINSGLGYITRIALDVTARKLYWLDLLQGKIRRSDLDGSDIEDVRTDVVFGGLLEVIDEDNFSTNPDCADGCPEDPGKTAAGVCGCGTADTDSDGDATADCNETCDTDPAKLAPGICGCGVADTDSDGDATADCNETCDTDPAKLTPGICGCGATDIDSDSDGTADCNETCDNDALKTTPGVCGCGVADTDSDSDGTANCNETCDNDPLKTSVGACGCGLADTDSDQDGTADCNETCDSDPLKLSPGACGCGNSDQDSDVDGIADCNEQIEPPESKDEARDLGEQAKDAAKDFKKGLSDSDSEALKETINDLADAFGAAANNTNFSRSQRNLFKKTRNCLSKLVTKQAGSKKFKELRKKALTLLKEMKKSLDHTGNG